MHFSCSVTQWEAGIFCSCHTIVQKVSFSLGLNTFLFGGNVMEVFHFKFKTLIISEEQPASEGLRIYERWLIFKDGNSGSGNADCLTIMFQHPLLHKSRRKPFWSQFLLSQQPLNASTRLLHNLFCLRHTYHKAPVDTGEEEKFKDLFLCST